jgi:hypothetical protein
VQALTLPAPADSETARILVRFVRQSLTGGTMTTWTNERGKRINESRSFVLHSIQAKHDTPQLLSGYAKAKRPIDAKRGPGVFLKPVKSKTPRSLSWRGFEG